MKTLRITVLTVLLLLGFVVPYAYSVIQGNYAVSMVDPANSIKYYTVLGDTTSGLWVNVKNSTLSVTQGTSPWVVGQTTGSNLHTVLDSGTLTSITNAVNVNATQTTNPWIVQNTAGGNACMNPASILLSVTGATSGTTAVQIIAASGSTKVYLCSLTVIAVSGTTPTFSLVYGTGVNCATGQNALVQAFSTGTAGQLFSFNLGKRLNDGKLL